MNLIYVWKIKEIIFLFFKWINRRHTTLLIHLKISLCFLHNFNVLFIRTKASSILDTRYREISRIGTSWFPERYAHSRAGVNTHIYARTYACSSALFAHPRRVSSARQWKIKVTRARYFIADVWAAAKSSKCGGSERIRRAEVRESAQGESKNISSSDADRGCDGDASASRRIPDLMLHSSVRSSLARRVFFFSFFSWHLKLMREIKWRLGTLNFILNKSWRMREFCFHISFNCFI